MCRVVSNMCYVLTLTLISIFVVLLAGKLQTRSHEKITLELSTCDCTSGNILFFHWLTANCLERMCGSRMASRRIVVADRFVKRSGYSQRRSANNLSDAPYSHSRTAAANQSQCTRICLS